MQDLRTAIAERLRNPDPYPHDRFAGRGIVTCAGGRRYFTCAWVLIWILRRVHQSKLPIQLWHLGRGEMSDAMRFTSGGRKTSRWSTLKPSCIDTQPR